MTIGDELDPAPRSSLRPPSRRATVVAGLLVAAVVLLGLGLEFGASGSGESSTPRPSASPTVPADLDGEPLLATPLALPGGDSLTLAELAGSKMVIINFWAKWCAPCVAEMPILEQVHRTDDRVVFVGVNEGDPAEQATAMARRTKITYRWALDPRGDLAALARTINLPTTLMISADGQVLAAKVGAFHSASELERWIASGVATP